MPIIKKITLFILVVAAPNLIYCQKKIRNSGPMENLLRTQVSGVQIDFVIEKPKISNCRDLRLKTVFRNTSESPIKINALIFNFPMLVLKIRKTDGTPVFPGPPPFPPQDDGITGRIEIAPDQYSECIFSGAEYFGSDLSKGKYQVSFIYTAPENEYGDWVGTIQSQWIDFEVTGKR